METGKRWGRLAAGTGMMLLLGLIYAWSIFVAPLEQEFGWTRSQTSFTFTVSISCFVLGLISSGFLARRLSPRIMIWLSAAALAVGFALCSRVTSLAGLYLSYGVLVGFPVGVAYNALVSALLRWFPEKRGLASGILMMGFGVGGMVLGSFITALMATSGWRNAFLLLAVIFGATLFLGAFAIRLPSDTAAGAAASGGQTADLSPGQMLRRKSFWIYLAWSVLCLAGGLIIIGHAKAIATESGVAEATAVFLAGVVSISNGLGRILNGIVYDRVGLQKTILLTTLYLLTASVLLILAGRTGLTVPLLLGFVFTGLGYGGLPTTSSTFTSSFYGARHFAINYGLVSSGMIPSALLGPYLAGVLRSSSGNYQSVFLVMLLFGALALVCSFGVRKP